MSHTSPTNLPEVILAAIAERVLPRETEICDFAGTLMRQGHSDAKIFGRHLNAIVLCNELLWAHESAHSADEGLHYAAEQLKCHFLANLQRLTK